MKISVALLFLLTAGTLTLFAGNTYGQRLKDTKILLVVRGKSLDAVLSDIEKLSGFHFVYISSKVKPYLIKRYTADSLSVEDILIDLLHPRGLHFRQRGDNVIIEQKNNPDKGAKVSAEPIKRSQAAVVINGNVVDEKGLPLPGVSVNVKGTRRSTTTKEDGSFRIEAQEGETLVFSFISYKTVEKVVTAPDTIKIRMMPESSQLNEIVVVGYGTQRRGDLTTAVSSLKASEVNNFTGTGVDKAMTGKMAGVQVLEPNGAPGAGITIAIRGKATVTAGTQPLYVIDGIPLSESNSTGPGLTVNPLNNINMADIETVDVLKDASAAAIYGSRGSNGVILITTKRGKKDKPTISYNGYAGYQDVSKKIKMLDAYQYADLIFDAHNNAYFDLLEDKGLTGSISDDNATRLAKLGGPAGATDQAYVLPPEIVPYLEGKPGLTNTDWQDAIFHNASTQNHTLSVAGGSDNMKYYLSGNYLNQQGVVIESGFKRYGGRVNLDASYKKLKLGATVNYGYEQYQFQPTEGRFASQEFIVPIALTAAPFFPVYNPDGSYNYSQYDYQYATSKTINPVALAELKNDDTSQGKLLGNLFAEYNFSPELSNKISFGININNANRNTFRPSVLPMVNPSSPTSNPTGSYRNLSLLNWIAENTLSYNKRFGDHSLNAVAALSAQKETISSSVINATGYANDLIKTLDGATSIQSFGGGTEQWALLSALTRVQYSYKDKYLASAAIRADGSSRFGANSKYGYFPSASIGWNVDREDFMQNVKAISSLKLRGSYGLTGNMQIGNYAYLALLLEDNYVFGPSGSGNLYNGLYQFTAGNDDLGWEKTSAFNLGADMGFFSDRLHLTVDAYVNNTTDLLLQVPVAHSSGYRDNLQNIGKVRNKGLEFTVTSNNQFGDFRITNSANISFNRNKVLDLGGAQSMITQAQGVIYFITQVGQPIGNYYTLVQDGIFRSQAELEDPNIPKVPGAKVGDMKFKDINGDQVIDPTNDRAITGNYMPKFTYGFSSQLQYGILDLNVALQGVYGNKIANINSRYINSLESFTNNTAEALDRFYAPDQPGSGNYPRANRSQRGLNANMSTYSIRSGAYLRIRDITLGVTLPDKWATGAGLSKARLYFTATNPFLFTKYNAYNPEISQVNNPLMPGVDYGSYPLSKSFVLGLNLSF